MREHAVINELVNDIKRLNKAIADVNWSAELIIASFNPKYGFVIGKNATKVARHLFLTKKLESYYQFTHKNSKRRMYVVTFKS